MKCPHCSFDNRDDAAFCENCGEVFVAASAKVSVPPVVEVPRSCACPTSPRRLPNRRRGPRWPIWSIQCPTAPMSPTCPASSGWSTQVTFRRRPLQAGDTAEIPRINEEHVPRARSYAMGPTEKELRRRDRQQKKLAKKFSKMQEKEEARKAKELLRAEKERLRAETAAEKERLARRRGRGPRAAADSRGGGPRGPARCRGCRAGRTRAA